MSFDFNVNSKKLLPVYIAAMALSIIGGIVMLCTVVPNASSVFMTVMAVFFAVEAILLGLAILFYIILSHDGEANFFLYDRKTRRNLDESELTFDRINSRMGYYMTLISASQEQMWQKNILAREDARYGADGVYKPLVAYKMLYDLIELDRPETWELFTGAEPAVIDTLCRVLASCGESAMATNLMDGYEGAEGVDDIEWVRDFIMGNAKYLRRRMTEYILKNIEEFY